MARLPARADRKSIGIDRGRIQAKCARFCPVHLQGQGPDKLGRYVDGFVVGATPLAPWSQLWTLVANCLA